MNRISKLVGIPRRRSSDGSYDLVEIGRAESPSGGVATALAAAGALVAAAFALGGVAVYAATDDGLSVVACETRTARPDVVSLALVGAGAAARLVVAERDAVAILALGDAAVRVLRRSGDAADSVTDLLEEDRRPTASPVVRVVAGAAGAALVVAEGWGVERWAGS